MESLTLTRKEAAERCNLSLPVLTSFMNRAENPLPYIRAGRKYLIPRAGLEEWLAAEAERQKHGRSV